MTDRRNTGLRCEVDAIFHFMNNETRWWHDELFYSDKGSTVKWSSFVVGFDFLVLRGIASVRYCYFIMDLFVVLSSRVQIPVVVCSTQRSASFTIQYYDC